MYFDINSIVEGEYYPGSFILGIDKRFFDGMKYSDFTNEEMATLAHEYIHYLQDISTSNGLLLFQHRAKLLQLNIALSQKETKVILPFDLEYCGVQNAYAQSQLLAFFEGGSLDKKIHHIDKIVVEEEELINEILENESDYKGRKKAQVNIYYDNRDIPTMLGSRYIIESMAYLIERHCFGAAERENEFPYNACEMVCREIYAKLLEHPECLVLLCELSLMSEDCGGYFYQLLVHLKATDIDFSDVNDLKQYLSNTMDKHILMMETAKKALPEHIDFMFPQKVPYMLPINLYVSTIFDAGFSWRRGNKYFISDIFNVKNPVEQLKYWISIFPTPMFIDNLSREFYGEFDSLSMMPVPLSILDYFKNPSKGCPLIDYCKYSGLGNVNKEQCLHRPWEQCQKKELCPLALYFTAFMLDKKQFIVENRVQ